jgi:hypothetical protein
MKDMNRNRHPSSRDGTTREIHHHARPAARPSWLRTLAAIRELREVSG